MKCKCIIFDLDGTIYFGNKLADKANDVIKLARKLYKNVFFVTNNSAKTRCEIWQKLVALGIDVLENEVITSSYAIAKYLKENNYTNIVCIGTDSLKQQINEFGVNISDNLAQAVVIGYNKGFKLSDIDFLKNINLADNYKIIVANRERSYPSDNAYILPGAGPIVSAVECLLNKQTDVVIGKPSPTMLEIMVSGLNLLPQEICVVGDSFESDIKMAMAYGSQSILISDKENDECKTIKKLEELLEIMK